MWINAALNRQLDLRKMVFAGTLLANGPIEEKPIIANKRVKGPRN